MADQTITAAMIDMTDLAMTARPVTTATGMTATAGTTATAATAQGHLPVAPTMTIVDPGLRLPSGRMTEGLQGTIMTVMSGGGVFMTRHLIMMTAAGMITSDLAEKKEGHAKKGNPGNPALTRRGLRRAEMEDGRAKWRLVRGVALRSRKRAASFSLLSFRILWTFGHRLHEFWR